MGKRGPQPVAIKDRFWSKVNKTDTCWLWTARTNNWGYGAICAGGMNNGWLRAHRVAWELTNGPIPKGAYVLHKCDVPACVNPDHLWLGSLKDNTQDMMRKGRTRGWFKKGDNYAVNARWAKYRLDHPKK